ncbi:MAG: Sec-independent protein translocase protein TatB [Caulobacteraceae bacterium]
MLTDLSAWHIMILVVVALVVVGPKDLPRMLRKVGQFMGRMRSMANEFRASFDEMARQSELDELRKEVEAMRQASQAALPQDLGIEAAMKSDAEAAYLANWEASHAPSTDAFADQPEPSILPPAAQTPAPAAAEPAKPKASRPRKAKADTGEAEPAPKPRARKPKPEAEA